MIESPKFHKGQIVVISSYQQITTEGAKAVVQIGKLDLARMLQEGGVQNLKEFGLHAGSVGTIKTTLIDGYAKVSFGKDKEIDIPQEAIETLNIKNFFTLVLPGMFGLR